MPEGYCVKERKKVEIKDPQQVTMKNGRPAIQGTCPDCGTGLFYDNKGGADALNQTIRSAARRGSRDRGARGRLRRLER
jgi:hypothetical protein